MIFNCEICPKEKNFRDKHDYERHLKSKKHIKNKRVNTHMNVEAYQQEQEDNRTKMMQAATRCQHTMLKPKAKASQKRSSHVDWENYLEHPQTESITIG